MSQQTPPTGNDPRGAFGSPLPAPATGVAQDSSAAWGSAPPPLPPRPFDVGPYSPPPPRPRRRIVLITLLILAIVGLGVSLLLNLVLLSTGVLLRDHTGREVTLTSGSASQRIAVIPLTGLIDERCATRFAKFMDRAQADGSIKAVVIQIDTPGGSVTASDNIHHRIEMFKQARQGVPVVVSMGGLATSGGYYVACAADHIFAQYTTLTGNIGVLMPRYNLSKLAETIGVKETTIVSTGARFKNAGAMLKSEDEVETRYFQGLIDNAFARFKTVIKQGRGAKLAKKPEELAAKVDELANGKVYMADESLALGLIDQIGYLDDACQFAASSASLKNPTVVRFENTPSLMEMLSSRSSSGEAQISDSGVTLHLGQDVLGGVSRPGLMYLWQGE